MSTIDQERAHEEDDHVHFPTPEEISCMLRGTGDQQQFDLGGAGYDFMLTLNPSGDVHYRVTTTIVGITYYHNTEQYCADEIMAEEIGFDRFHSDGNDEFDLSHVQSPEDVKQLLRGRLDEFQLVINPMKDGTIQLTISHPNDPYGRELHTFAVVDEISRNGTKLYPPSGAAQPQG